MKGATIIARSNPATPALERLATALANAWREGSTIALPSDGEGVTSREEAYAVADRMAELVGDVCAGWKVGAVLPAVQRLEGHDGPIPGRLFASRVWASPARIPARHFDGYKIECEFAFRFDRALAPRSGGYARDELVAGVTLLPGLEVAGSRYAPAADRRPTTHETIADNGAGGGYVTGAAVPGWRGLDLDAMPIVAGVEGRAPVEVYAGDARLSPVDVLVATVAALGQRGIGFAAGALLSTGSLTVPAPLTRGQAFTARFGDLPVLRVEMQ